MEKSKQPETQLWLKLAEARTSGVQPPHRRHLHGLERSDKASPPPGVFLEGPLILFRALNPVSYEVRGEKLVSISKAE